MSIRLKVILPYLILTVIVSMIGVYVFTSLMSISLGDRLANQLVETGRVVSDGFVKLDVRQYDIARNVAFTIGMIESLQREDGDAVYELAQTMPVVYDVDSIVLITPQGNEIVHLIKNDLKLVDRITDNSGIVGTSLVAPFLESKDPRAEPKQALALNSINGQTYYYTSIPVEDATGGFAGVVVVGTSLKTLLPELKRTSLADVIIYSGDGRVAGITFDITDPASLDAVSITSDERLSIFVSEGLVTGANISIDRRVFILARGPLQVGNTRIGVFAVALPRDFVTQSASEGRWLYTGLFGILFVIVIFIGLLVSRIIITPLYSLVNTSQAISAGDLEKRTEIKSNDEIGILATTFDGMTANLQERTVQLERANQVLKNIDKTKSNFIQISAHELRTPLTLIMGYSQMLEQDAKNDPELKSLAQGILDGSERMTSIVESMLDVSRIDSNALFLRKTGLRIDLLIRKVYKGFEKALLERNIDFQMLDLRDLPLIPADPDQLQKVFYHIIMNAIKFTPDGGAITVSGRYVNDVSESCVEISIRDTGIGINPQMHELIFEKFNQTGDVLLHSSGKTKFKGGGPGLGLAIARGIVQAHGGRIWVESAGYNEQTNPGSTFYISLPAPDENGGGAP